MKKLLCIVSLNLIIGLWGQELRANLIFTGAAIANPLQSDGSSLGGGFLSILVVDRSGDGFSANVNFGLTQGDNLNQFVGNSDDVVISTNSTGSTPFRVLGTADFNLGNGIDVGDAFGVYFFDQIVAGSTTVDSLTHYGFATDANWLVPGDGSNIDFKLSPYGGQFQQLTNTQASYAVAIPEPANAFLLGFGAALYAIGRRQRPRRARGVSHHSASE
jgi:hypothetical protein